MTRIENSLALPIGQFVHPMAMATGSAIALSGLTLLAAQLWAAL